MNILNTLKLLNPDPFPPILDIQACMHPPSTSSKHTHYTRCEYHQTGVTGVNLEADYQCSTKCDTKILLFFNICRVEMEVRGMWGEISFFPELCQLLFLLLQSPPPIASLSVASLFRARLLKIIAPLYLSENLRQNLCLEFSSALR